MKTFKLLSLIGLFFTITNAAIAQSSQSETFTVSGNCAMCKAKIETAAKNAGATYAAWDLEAKELTVKFAVDKTSKAAIQKKIAEAGYDNEGVKATDTTYDKLHGCCKYERKTSDAKAAGCTKGSDETKKEGCCKKGDKEEKGEKACCKKGDKEGKSCCKKS